MIEHPTNVACEKQVVVNFAHSYWHYKTEIKIKNSLMGNLENHISREEHDKSLLQHLQTNYTF